MAFDHNHTSIVVYRIMSDNPDAADMNASFQEVRALTAMSIIEPDHDNYQVIREGNVTVTVYAYRRKQ